jgi:hypothetical protein
MYFEEILFDDLLNVTLRALQGDCVEVRSLD